MDGFTGDITANCIKFAGKECAVWSHVDCLEKEVGGGDWGCVFFNFILV